MRKQSLLTGSLRAQDALGVRAAAVALAPLVAAIDLALLGIHRGRARATRQAILGHEFGRNMIKRILAEHGISPAPVRGKTIPWKTFLQAHFGGTAAIDFPVVAPAPGSADPRRRAAAAAERLGG